MQFRYLETFYDIEYYKPSLFTSSGSSFETRATKELQVSTDEGKTWNTVPVEAVYKTLPINTHIEV